MSIQNDKYITQLVKNIKSDMETYNKTLNKLEEEGKITYLDMMEINNTTKIIGINFKNIFRRQQ